MAKMNPARAAHLEDALREAEARFFATFELAPVGIAHVAPDGRLLRVNRRLCAILGYDEEELAGRRVQELTHPEDLAADLDQALRTLAGEQTSYAIEKRYLRKDGTPVWTDVRVSLVRELPSEKPLYFVAVIDDITRQRRAEEALARQGEETRALLDRLPDIVTRLDREGRHLYVNPAVERATGRPAADFIGRTNAELGMPDALVRLWGDAVRSVIDANAPREIRFVFPTPQGERGFWSLMVPEHDEDGAVRGLLSVARDVTHAREGDAGEGDALLRFLAEMVPQMVWSTRPDGYHDYYNSRWFEYTGLRFEDTAGPRWNEVLHPDDRERAWRTWEQSLRTGEPYSIEYRFRRWDGAYRWFLGLALPLRGEDGRIERWFGTCTDIQAQKDGEQRLLDTQARLRAALDASATGTFLWDPRTDALDWDAPLAGLFGVAPEAAPRTREQFLALVHPDDRARMAAESARIAAAGGRYQVEFRVVLPDGSVRWLLDKGSTRVDADGRPVAVTGACVDITERKAAELEGAGLLAAAQAARGDAEAASHVKSQFVATMSHEIRTPINAVLGYADLLDLEVHGPLNDTQHEQVRRILRSGRHLLALVNDTLDMAKIEAGEMHVAREPVEVRALGRAALEMTETLAATRRIALADETEELDGLAAWGDEDRVRQILVNLLTNACKFTPAGGAVRVGPSAQPAPGEGVDGSAWIGIDVADTGPGIAPEMQERVFMPFVQETVAGRRASEGTGLGLAISRTLARLMGGEITLRSTPGEGSTFTLWLRRADG